MMVMTTTMMNYDDLLTDWLLDLLTDWPTDCMGDGAVAITCTFEGYDCG